MGSPPGTAPARRGVVSPAPAGGRHCGGDSHRDFRRVARPGRDGGRGYDKSNRSREPSGRPPPRPARRLAGCATIRRRWIRPGARRRWPRCVRSARWPPLRAPAGWPGSARWAPRRRWPRSMGPWDGRSPGVGPRGLGSPDGRSSETPFFRPRPRRSCHRRSCHRCR